MPVQSKRVVLARAGGFALILLALAGCGNSKEGQVSGTVKVGGAPLETGSITFLPADGKTATAGAEIKNGRYSAKVPVGMMKVSISSPKVVGKKKVYPTPESPEMPITVEAILERYNDKTELTLDVKPGTNNKDWDLDKK
jgi:hypothetical protein